MASAVEPVIAHRPEPNLFNETAAGVILLLFWCAGALAMLPLTSSLLHLWHEDPLRSLGVVFPFVSPILIVRAWRQTAWTWKGTAWGLLPMATTVLVARYLGDGVISYRFGEHAIGLLQPGLFYFGYGSGVVLLVGGTHLWRRCLFPLFLLFCVNPIPHLFNDFIDLPLQAASAGTARAFANALGLHPSGEQLEMLFAPRFGMVIVPGCNGVRGSVTMGYLMLLLGYWRRYRPVRLALYVVAAVALGYLLNLLRLCVLVLYYWAGIHIQSLRPHGEGIDYIIGGSLFLLITSIAGWLLFRKGDPAETLAVEHPMPWNSLLGSGRVRMAALLVLLCAIPEVPSAYARIRFGSEDFTDARLVLKALPASAGVWKRGAFSFEKQEADGKIIWVWAPYTRDDGQVVELGVWLSPLQHYALNSRRIHGDTPTWTGNFQAEASGGEPVRLSAFTMDDDFAAGDQPVPTLFAETTCWADRCSDASMVGFGKQGLSIAVAPMSTHSEPRLAMLLRSPEPAGKDAVAARVSAQQKVQSLISALDLRSLNQQLGTR